MAAHALDPSPQTLFPRYRKELAQEVAAKLLPAVRPALDALDAADPSARAQALDALEDLLDEALRRHRERSLVGLDAPLTHRAFLAWDSLQIDDAPGLLCLPETPPDLRRRLLLRRGALDQALGLPDRLAHRLLPTLDALARAHGAVRVLELGAGAGVWGAALLRAAQARGIPVELTSTQPHADLLDLAAPALEGLPARVEVLDPRDLSSLSPDAHHLALGAWLLHPMTAGQLGRLLLNLDRAHTAGFALIDLARAPLVPALTRLALRAPQDQELSQELRYARRRAWAMPELELVGALALPHRPPRAERLHPFAALLSNLA